MFVNTYARYLEDDVENQDTPDSSDILQEVSQESPVKPEKTEESRDLHKTRSISVPCCSRKIPRPPDIYYKDVLMHP